MSNGNDSFVLPPSRPPQSVTPEEKAKLANYIAPGSGMNATLEIAADLGDSLDEVPLFKGLSLRALVGGGGVNAGAWEEGKTIEELVAMGAQPGEKYYCSFNFPCAKDVNTLPNVQQMLYKFETGWENGLQSILSELGYPSSDYLTVFCQVPDMQTDLQTQAGELFGQFKANAPAPVDPFAPPVGLPPSQQ